MRTSPELRTARIALDLLVCLDGSSHAVRAVTPARALAAQRGEDISVLVLDRRSPTIDQVTKQLAAENVSPASVTTAASRQEMIDRLVAAARDGATPVLAAFGPTATTSHLTGILGELVRAEVHQVLAIGPMVSQTPESAGSIVVTTDRVRSVDPLIDATTPFVLETTTKIMVAHVVPPAEPGLPLSTNRDAAKFRSHFDVPVEAAAVTGADISLAIADLAQREHASVVLARSWHRLGPGDHASASRSLSIVATAPCPVLIVTQF